ncbi:MAG TPA: AsmA family protein, partial [Coxiellaceae bacterium]|nr:AsmA family protein [Coxiellaceae bacterium]
INPNDYKAQIITAANKATGRELSINGDIKLSLFPWFGVDIEGIELSNPAGFGQQAFLKVGEAEIKLHLLPLLFGKVEFGAIVLNQADLNLIKKSATSNNWSDLQSGSSATNNSDDNNGSKETAKDSSSFFKQIDITNVSIQNSHVKWTDSTTNNVVDVNNLNLDSSSIGLAKSFPIYLSFNLVGTNPKLNMQFNGNTNAYIDPKNKVYKLDSLQANGQVSTQTASNLSFAVKGNFNVNLKEQAWDLSNVSANLAQMSLEITSKGDLSKSSSSGSVKIKSFNAQTLLQQINPGIKFANSSALTNVSAKFTYTFSPQLVQIPDLEAKIDSSKLNANLNYQGTGKRSLNYLVQLDKIDLDRYQISIPKSAPAPTKASNSAASTNTNAASSVAFFGNLKGSGKIQIGELTYNQVALSNILIQSTSANNVLNISPISASVYGGKINANAKLNLQSSTPTVTADATLSNLDLNRALSKNGQSSNISGLLTLKTQLNSVGKTPEAWINNLQGNGTLDVAQGVINGIDLNFWLLQGASILKKLTPSLKGNTNRTPFNGMHATFTIYQGILSNQDLLISTQALSAKGNGKINLPQQSISYRLYVRSNDKSLLSNNMQVPLIISGPLADPKVQLDMANLTASLIKDGLIAPVGAAKAIPAGAINILTKIVAP